MASNDSLAACILAISSVVACAALWQFSTSSRITMRVVYACTKPFLTVGGCFLPMLALETVLAYVLFKDLSDTHFGTLQKSVSSVFMVTSLSAIEIEDLILENWLASVFFAFFLYMKIALLRVGSAIGLQYGLGGSAGLGFAKVMKAYSHYLWPNVLHSGTIFLLILTLESSLAQFLFKEVSPTNFGSLKKSFGSVFLVTSLSTSTVADLLNESWLAIIFFGLFLFVKVVYLWIVNALALNQALAALAEPEQDYTLAQ